MVAVIFVFLIQIVHILSWDLSDFIVISFSMSDYSIDSSLGLLSSLLFAPSLSIFCHCCVLSIVLSIVYVLRQDPSTENQWQLFAYMVLSTHNLRRRECLFSDSSRSAGKDFEKDHFYWPNVDHLLTPGSRVMPIAIHMYGDEGGSQGDKSAAFARRRGGGCWSDKINRGQL